MSEWWHSFIWWCGQRKTAHTLWPPSPHVALQLTRQDKGRHYRKSGKIGASLWKRCRVREAVTDTTSAKQGAAGQWGWLQGGTSQSQSQLGWKRPLRTLSPTYHPSPRYQQNHGTGFVRKPTSRFSFNTSRGSAYTARPIPISNHPFC